MPNCRSLFGLKAIHQIGNENLLDTHFHEIGGGCGFALISRQQIPLNPQDGPQKMDLGRPSRLCVRSVNYFFIK
jgi:hypothetical protein